MRVHPEGDLSAVQVENGEAPALGLRSHLDNSRALLAVIALTLFGVFLPTVIVPYAFSDDYAILAMADGLGSNPSFGKNVFDASAVNGRPIAGALTQALFSAAGTIANLRFVRLLAVLAILALALLLHWALVRSAIGRAPAALIAVFVCSLPAFQVYASWTVLFHAPLAALLAACASVLAVWAVEGSRDFFTDRIVGASVFLLAALLVYQPGAMFFWVFLAVAALGVVSDSRRLVRLVRTHFGVAAIALPLAFLVAKLSAHVIGNNAPNATRNSLTHDIPGKAHWFADQPLYQSLNLFDLTPSRWLAGVVAIVTVAGIALLIQRRSASPLLCAGVAAVLIPLAYLPNLVVKENLATFRTQVALSSLLALYFSIGALGIWLTIRDRLRYRVSEMSSLAVGRIALAAAIAFVATTSYIAARNVTTLFTDPQMTELRIMRSQVAAIPVGAPVIAFAGAGYYEGLTDLVRYDEFGLPSTSQVFMEAPAVYLLLRELGRLPAQGPKPNVEILSWPASTIPTDKPVVDIRHLRDLR